MTTLTYALLILLMGRDGVDETNAVFLMETAKQNLIRAGYDPELERDENETDDIISGLLAKGDIFSIL